MIYDLDEHMILCHQILVWKGNCYLDRTLILSHKEETGKILKEFGGFHSSGIKQIFPGKESIFTGFGSWDNNLGWVAQWGGVLKWAWEINYVGSMNQWANHSPRQIGLQKFPEATATLFISLPTYCSKWEFPGRTKLCGHRSLQSSSWWWGSMDTGCLPSPLIPGQVPVPLTTLCLLQ